MIRNTSCGVVLVLTLVFGAASHTLASDGKAQNGSSVALLAGEVKSNDGDRKPGTEFKDCTGCPAMVVVPPGRFMMGSPPDEKGRIENEGPRHEVTIARSFAVGKYEVTFDEWDTCVAERACPAAGDSGFGRGRRPVINVSYDSIGRYLAWLSAKAGTKYRLLTESEWEYAARAGSDKSRFWGESLDDACRYANVFNPSTQTKYKDKDRQPFKCDDRYLETAPVGTFKPNRFGLYDMLGNVWEWVEDCWNASYAGAPDDGRPWLTGDCSKRVMRGGGWYFGPRNVRSAKRINIPASGSGHDVGFRVARTLL